MTSSVTKAFRDLLRRLPTAPQEQAARAYALWRTDPYHKSRQCKRVSQRQPMYAVRVGLGYRALGLRAGAHGYGFWIGPHAEYDALLKGIERRGAYGSAPGTLRPSGAWREPIFLAVQPTPLDAWLKRWPKGGRF